MVTPPKRLLRIKRPIFALDLIENLEEQLKNRYDVYSKADLIIKNDNINEIECSELILEKLSNYE